MCYKQKYIERHSSRALVTDYNEKLRPPREYKQNDYGKMEWKGSK